jgi:uncharacterized protein YndB with AHSA1/START domain
METRQPVILTVAVTIDAPLSVVWKRWTTPADIRVWNTASDDWHTTKAENDLREGGSFLFRMEAKDGSFGFDFSGTYDEVIPNRLIEYTLADERKVRVAFQSREDKTKVIETFEAETVNPVELQQTGWQAILDNFKKYLETTLR